MFCHMECAMADLSFEYLTDLEGQPRAVVIPIELWHKILPQAPVTLDNLSEALEDYCLGQAMDESKNSPLLSSDEALRFLEDSND